MLSIKMQTQSVLFFPPLRTKLHKIPARNKHLPRNLVMYCSFFEMDEKYREMFTVANKQRK